MVCTTQQDVTDIQLPDIYICLKDHVQFKKKEQRKEGYANLLAYLTGTRRSTSHVTWEGLSDIPYANMTNKLFNHIDLDKLVLTGNPDEAWDFDIENQNLAEYFAIMNGFCVKIEMTPVNTPKKAMYSLSIHGSPESILQVLISEPGSSTYYQLSSDQLLGDIIETSNLTDKYYDITLEKEIMMAEVGECSNYGKGHKFDSYADCLANMTEEYLRPFFGCLIPWMGPPNHPSLCKGKVQFSPKERIIMLQRDMRGDSI